LTWREPAGKDFDEMTVRVGFVGCGGRAVREMMFGNLPRPEVISTPMLVLGAADDGAFTQDEVRGTASAYGTDAHFFSDVGHDMMLEPGWQAVAERIVQWLGHRGL